MSLKRWIDDGKKTFPKLVCLPHKLSTPNHREPVGLWHPQLGYVARLGVVGRKEVGEQEGGAVHSDLVTNYSSIIEC